MPLKRCRKDGKPGYKWGDRGKCYTYTPNNDKERREAKKKAIKQGIAIGDIKNTKNLIDGMLYNINELEMTIDEEVFSNTIAILSKLTGVYEYRIVEFLESQLEAKLDMFEGDYIIVREDGTQLIKYRENGVIVPDLLLEQMKKLDENDELTCDEMIKARYTLKQIADIVTKLLILRKWTRKYINDLPDECFACIEPGGKKDKDGKTVPRSLRHFPYKNRKLEIDKPHLVNALARLPQSNVSESCKKKAKQTLCRAVRTWNKTHKDKIESEVCKE